MVVSSALWKGKESEAGVGSSRECQGPMSHQNKNSIFLAEFFSKKKIIRNSSVEYRAALLPRYNEKHNTQT